jgi:hypothetical protein
MQDADMDKAGDVARKFTSRGMDVLAKNGDGRIVLAVVGLGADKIKLSEINRMSGVKSCERKNKFFTDNHGDFKDACFFFRWGY